VGRGGGRSRREEEKRPWQATPFILTHCSPPPHTHTPLLLLLLPPPPPPLQSYNDRMDKLMEEARLKDIKRREEEERRKLEQRVRDREVIMSQIKEAEKRKIVAEEAREQENQVGS